MAEFRNPRLRQPWFACIPSQQLAHVCQLRSQSEIEILIPYANASLDETQQLFWLRGSTLNDGTLQTLRAVLGAQIYRSLKDGQLIPEKATLPQGYAPEGNWQPLHRSITQSLPTRRFAERRVNAVRIRLERSTRPQTPTLVSAPRKHWLAYAATAPSVRLNRLMFATSEDRSIILGQPLPPILGTFYWTHDGIAAPVGFQWAPNVSPSVMRKKLRINKDDIAILQISGEFVVIRHDQFVKATRSAVRQTEGARHDDI